MEFKNFAKALGSGLFAEILCLGNGYVDFVAFYYYSGFTGHI